MKSIDTTLGFLRREWLAWQDEGQEDAADFHGNEEWPDDLAITLYADGSVNVRGGENQQIAGPFSERDRIEYLSDWLQLLRDIENPPPLFTGHADPRVIGGYLERSPEEIARKARRDLAERRQYLKDVGRPDDSPVEITVFRLDRRTRKPVEKLESFCV